MQNATNDASAVPENIYSHRGTTEGLIKTNYGPMKILLNMIVCLWVFYERTGSSILNGIPKIIHLFKLFRFNLYSFDTRYLFINVYQYFILNEFEKYLVISLELEDF